jgi:competence protein ComEC
MDLLRLRGRIQSRIREIYPERAPLVEALVLARKEGVSVELRESFALSGTAHLLAISGFHVGIIAGLLLSLGRLMGASRRVSWVTAAAGSWGYVLFIGAPPAAARASTILSFVAIGRIRGSPTVPSAALASAAVMLLILDPGSLAAVGFQLSFAGAAGLTLIRPALESRWLRGGDGWRSDAPAWLHRAGRTLRGATLAGVSATLPTLPLVAWHFGRVSLAGIPATLMASPMVALAIPGILSSLLLSLIHESGARLLARGVELILACLVGTVEGVARIPGASVWVPQWWIPVALIAGAATAVALRMIRDLGSTVRRWIAAQAAAAAVMLAPLTVAVFAGPSLELVFLDVGQGDAVLVRSPRGRWVLVDAGPASDRYDAGERVVVPYLKRRGARGLDALILTHPDQDHIGGAAAVLRHLPVDAVIDPGLPAGKDPYLQALSEARSRGSGWMRAQQGREMELDGVRLDVLHPPAMNAEDPEGFNDASVVVAVHFGEFSALLTGDASVHVERRIAQGAGVGPAQVIKVGHHGSRTSSAWELLEATRPEVAVISVGRGNRYGHPHPEVVDRLRRVGARVLRTDRNGTVTIRVRRDGSYRVRVGR